MKTKFNSFLLKNLCKGVLIGWGVLFLFLASDLGGVRTLIFSSGNAVMAVGLLMMGFAITFGNCVMGIAAVRLLPKKAPHATSKLD